MQTISEAKPRRGETKIASHFNGWYGKGTLVVDIHSTSR